ncbi:hypothetical protein [Nocardioides speluncae]|uniref:hypothetical protein n=1 Tax=Nocardioides speluncae TaxID=2670337 RepID=UPI000D68A3EE|nr:hypothetical protein [Nocardioides speluncae]
MDVVSEQAQRVLMYVETLNAQGVRPQARFVDAFADEPDRRQTVVDDTAERIMLESYSSYLTRLGWVEIVEGGVAVSEIGTALVRALTGATVGSGGGRRALPTPRNEPTLPGPSVGPWEPAEAGRHPGR